MKGGNPMERLNQSRGSRTGISGRWKKIFRPLAAFIFGTLVATGCAHFPINQPIKEIRPDVGYRATQIKDPENSDHMLLYLTFSGGGTRAASLSYGVLEELKKT